jgi:hypothetical protein
MLLPSSYGLLLKELGRLRNALKEEIEVNHILLDLRHWLIDEHTSDFGGEIIDECLDEFENCATNSLLVRWIHFVNCTQNWNSNAVELARKGMG